MAKKGQKFKEYTENFILEVMEYADENSLRKASDKFKIPYETVATWRYRINQGNSALSKRGRTKDGDISYQEKYEILKKLRDFHKSQTKKN